MVCKVFWGGKANKHHSFHNRTPMTDQRHDDSLDYLGSGSELGVDLQKHGWLQGKEPCEPGWVLWDSSLHEETSQFRGNSCITWSVVNCTSSEIRLINIFVWDATATLAMSKLGSVQFSFLCFWDFSFWTLCSRLGLTVTNNNMGLAGALISSS